MLLKSKFTVTLIVGLTLLVAGGSKANADDIVGDFSTSSNPTGNWSYGYTGSLGGTFNLFTVGDSVPCGGGTLDRWTTPSGFPVAENNTSGTTESCATDSLPPGVLYMHPDSSGAEAVVRWTAPSSGTYDIQGMFEGLDFLYPTSTDVHVLLNSATSLFSGAISTFEVPLNFSLAEALSTGDTIDFVVGFGSDGSFVGDGTGLNGTITSSSNAVPEPSTLLLLGTGVLGLGLLGKRRRRELRTR